MLAVVSLIVTKLVIQITYLFYFVKNKMSLYR